MITHPPLFSARSRILRAAAAATIVSRDPIILMMRGRESRYSRQIRFAPVGEQGQRQIRASRVAIVGCGALGSVQAEALARAGVGLLRLIDRDFVEWSNLQRQFLFDESDAAEGLPKAVAAARRLARVNSDVALEPVVADLAPSNAAELLEGIDLILDGTDNFETRYLINDAAIYWRIPWIYGAAVGSYGLKLAIIPGVTACLKCIYPEPPKGSQPTCETAGVLGPVTTTIAALQAGDALKILACGPDGLNALLTTADVWTGEIRQIHPPARDPDCPSCVRREFAHLDGRRRAPVSLCGRNAVQIHRNLGVRGGVLPGCDGEDDRLAVGRPDGVDLVARSFAGAAGEARLTIFPDGRAIVKGTTDVGVARSLYAQYVGA